MAHVSVPSGKRAPRKNLLLFFCRRFQMQIISFLFFFASVRSRGFPFHSAVCLGAEEAFHFTIFLLQLRVSEQRERLTDQQYRILSASSHGSYSEKRSPCQYCSIFLSLCVRIADCFGCLFNLPLPFSCARPHPTNAIACGFFCLRRRQNRLDSFG